MKSNQTNYKVKNPILFITFRRPSTTAAVFKEIRKAKPHKLYLVQNYPSSKSHEEQKKWMEVRAIIENIDWECEVIKLFRKEHLEVQESISSAINWFFEKEEMGIILEDDCLPTNDFYYFCDYALDKFKNNSNIFAITGDNFQDNNFRGDSSYYFSKHMHVWGWASWRRAWKTYDVKISFWPEYKKSKNWKSYNNSLHEKKYWELIYTKTYLNKIYTWDYQWNLAIWKNNGMVVTPNVNLVTNIGFGSEATNTTASDDKASMMRVGSMNSISDPQKIDINKDADNYVFNNYLGGNDPFFFKTLILILRIVLIKLK